MTESALYSSPVFRVLQVCCNCSSCSTTLGHLYYLEKTLLSWNIIARMISLSFLKLCFIYSLHSQSYRITW